MLDDEQHAIDALTDALAAFEAVEVVGAFTDPLAALEQMTELDCQVVFLDIEMPGVNGLELAEKIVARDPDVRIVFVTAYDQYAVEAFDVSAVDYLLKPIRHERMAKTLAKLAAEVQKHRRAAQQSEACISYFGQFQINVGPQLDEPVKLRTKKAIELLAYLAHHRGEDVHKMRIVEEVWPEMDAERALAYLHTCVYQIRKSLKDYGLQHNMTIAFAHDCYRLTVKNVGDEVEEFLEAAAGKHAITAETIGACERAAALYRGHYLEEHGFPWAAAQQQRLFLVFSGLAARMADYYREQGMYAEAAIQLQRVLEMDPIADAVHEMLMRVYAEMGEPAALIEHYNTMVWTYREEFGLEPNPKTVELYELLSKRLRERSE